MELTRKQFTVMEKVISSETPLTQRDAEKLTGFSLGTVNKVFKELSDSGLILDGKATDKGIEVMEQYRAKRAGVSGVQTAPAPAASRPAPFAAPAAPAQTAAPAAPRKNPFG